MKTSTMELRRRIGTIWPKLMEFSLPFISDDGTSRSPLMVHILRANQAIPNARMQVRELMSAIRAKYIELIVSMKIASSM